jgi:hypothetical protein
MEIALHMALFLERNYRSLRDAGIEPLCDPGLHDVEYSQRGYTTFVYHGYTAAQIFPKAGDLLKFEYNNILYQVSSITDEWPEYEYMFHKYWWKAYVDVATDNGQNVSQEVQDNPLNNHFTRITLVNKAKTERLTIDSNLCFHNLVSGINRDMGNLVIIELKRDGLQPSPVLEMLRCLRIHPHGFSKYCMGSALTNPDLQVHRFKPKLIEVNKIINS